jgi:hypothetical protein
MKESVIVLLVALLSTGCAVQKNYGASGGSKSDGTVKMSYTYGAFQIPKVNEAGALKMATSRCNSWGYDSAQSFDFVDKRCQQYSADMGCIAWIVTKEFQCTSKESNNEQIQ